MVVKLLFVVKDRYTFPKKGLMLTPGLYLDSIEEPIAAGTKIKLIKPDGTEVETEIKGIATSTPSPILIAEEFTKKDVPVRTEVWLHSN